VDIAIIGKNSIKLKGKQVTFVVDPTKEMPKTSSDAIILLDNELDTDVSRATESRIEIVGPGEYEVSGVKVSGTKTPKGMLYKFLIDNMSVIMGFAVDVKIEGFNDCDVAIVNTSRDFNEAFVTGLEPKMAVLYGDKKIESAKTLGTENVALVPKVTAVKDKFPEKMEVVVLG
jgi:hypothetical protein